MVMYGNKMRDNFTFSQKLRIITKRLPTLTQVDKVFGIYQCPLCKQPMALGFETKEDGRPYQGNENYQKVHLDLGFKVIPSWYPNVSRIEIDHINCCYLGGKAITTNGWLICKECNRLCREHLTENDKFELWNGMEYMEEDGEYVVEGNKVNHYQDGVLVKTIKNPKFVISKLREKEINIGSPMEEG